MVTTLYAGLGETTLGNFAILRMFGRKESLKLVLTTPYCSNMFPRVLKMVSPDFKMLKLHEIN